MANSNSALKISQGYGFKPGFGHFFLFSDFGTPQAPVIMKFEAICLWEKATDMAPGPLWPIGPEGPMGPLGTHGGPW